MMRKDGFTIIELLVTLIILGILASIAIPGFSRLIPNYRLRSALRDVCSNFQLAKMTAVRRNRNCTVTFNQAIGGTTYNYAVYVDSDKDLEYDAGEEIVIQVLFSERYEGVTFDTSQGGGDGLTFGDNDDGLPSIAFSSNGFTKNNTGGFGTGTAFLKNTKNRTGSVVVSPLGNININY
ncbi:MAG: GspH/FimT family pseudopilin [Deltaproteobacteria bacterium]|nr:MAG: GspH/FimT family pseudopilin [Deltaproteobacteria bacterium]